MDDVSLELAPRVTLGLILRPVVAIMDPNGIRALSAAVWHLTNLLSVEEGLEVSHLSGELSVDLNLSAQAIVKDSLVNVGEGLDITSLLVSIVKHHPVLLALVLDVQEGGWVVVCDSLCQ